MADMPEYRRACWLVESLGDLIIDRFLGEGGKVYEGSA